MAKHATTRQTLTVTGEPGCPTPTKVGYFHRADARRAKRKIALSTGDKVHVYPCVCGLFHVGKPFFPSRDLARQAQAAKAARLD